MILTKLDGDARGGAALSVKNVVGRPIAFASTGERLADFDLFHPDRMASRILGMGDVLTLIEQAEREFDHDVATEGATRMLEGRFTLEDFLAQLQQVKKLGSLGGLLALMPGVPKELKQNANIDDGQVAQVEAIIRSMTRRERERARRSSTGRGGPGSPGAAAPPPRRSTSSCASSKRPSSSCGIRGCSAGCWAEGARASWPRPWPSGWATQAGRCPRGSTAWAPQDWAGGPWAPGCSARAASRAARSTGRRGQGPPGLEEEEGWSGDPEGRRALRARSRPAGPRRAQPERAMFRPRARGGPQWEVRVPRVRGRHDEEGRESDGGSEAPPHADGEEEAADLPGRGGRRPVAARRPVHRDRGDLRTPGRSTAEPDAIVQIDNDKALKWLRQGAQPTERVEKLLRTSGAWDEFRPGAK